jgi:hypothetical protein
LRGVASERLLDALVFSSPTLRWRDVLVAGRWRVRAGRHRAAAAIADRFAAVLAELGAPGPSATAPLSS